MKDTPRKKPKTLLDLLAKLDVQYGKPKTSNYDQSSNLTYPRTRTQGNDWGVEMPTSSRLYEPFEEEENLVPERLNDYDSLWLPNVQKRAPAFRKNPRFWWDDKYGRYRQLM